MFEKIWTYEEALEVFPEVKKITEDYYNLTKEINDQLESSIFPENVMESMEESMKTLVRDWSQKINAMGIDVKGIWLVDFNNGEGYYCWKLGEQELMYEHSYSEGFAGRKLIKRKKA